MGFAIDLQIGKDAEKIFAKYLIDFPDFVSIEIPSGKFKDYDIKLTTKTKIITYEVKADTMAHKTGNFVIETRFKGEASGIYASKADYIVYCVKNEWYIQKRGDLILKLIDTPKRTTKGGDGWNSELYVISCDELDNLFEHLNLNPNNYGENGEARLSDNGSSTEFSKGV